VFALYEHNFQDLDKLIYSFLPILIVGFFEDIKKEIKPVLRLFAMILSVSMLYLFFDIGIHSLEFNVLDYFLQHKLTSFLLTLIVGVGLINSINIIDGLNGLMLGFALIVMTVIAIVANIVGDNYHFDLMLTLIPIILVLFVFNFPFGKIFAGDTGAYTLGLFLGMLGLSFAEINDEVSIWFVLTIFIYPLYETVFSIYRRKFKSNKKAMKPDNEHLHSLLFKKVVVKKCKFSRPEICNSITAILGWLLALSSIIPGIIFYDNQEILIFFIFVFMFIFTYSHNILQKMD